MKWNCMTKYISIEAYLEYQKIVNENEEPDMKKLDEFFVTHWLPSLREIKEQNLRVYLNNDVAVNIYNVEEMKKDRVLVTDKIW